MAFVTSALIPMLQEVAKETTTFINKLQGKPFPGFVANEYGYKQYVSQVSDQLKKYSNVKVMIEEKQRVYKRTFNTYMALIIVISVFIYCFIFYMIWKKIDKMCLKYKLVLWTVVGAMTLLFICIWIAIHFIRKRKINYYDTIYNWGPIEESEPLIRNIAHMFQWQKDGDDVSIRSNNPLFLYTYTKLNPEVQASTSLSPGLSTGAEMNKSCCADRSKFIKAPNTDSYISNCLPGEFKNGSDGYMYPFLNVPDSSALKFNSIVFRKMIKRFDLYSQLMRITQAATFFKNFMLKKGDAVYGSQNMKRIDSTVRKQIVDDTIELLTSGKLLVLEGVNVIDVAYTDLKKTIEGKEPFVSVVEVKSVDDLFQMCLNDKECMVASYDPATKKGYLLKNVIPNMLESGMPFLKYDPIATGNLCFIKNADRVDRLTMQSFAYSHGVITGPKFANENSCATNESGCFSIMATKQTRTAADQGGQTTYDEVFKATDLVPASTGVTYTSQMSAIIRKHGVSSLERLTTQHKQVVITAICDIIVDADQTLTFNFNQKESDRIITRVSNKSKSVGSAMNDILLEVPLKISEKAKEKEEKELKVQGARAKYIPVSRFIEKMGSMTSKDFVMNFAFYAEELRECGLGIKMLKDKYDFTADLHKNRTMLAQTLLPILLTSALMFCVSYSIWEWLATQYDVNNVIYNMNKEIEDTRSLYMKQKQGVAAGGPAAEPAPATTTKTAATAGGAEEPEAQIPESVKKNLEQVELNLKSAKAGLLMKHISIFIIIMVAYFVFDTYFKKSKDLYEYNDLMLTQNGQKLVSSADKLFRDMMSDVQADNYGILKEAGVLDIDAKAELERRGIEYDIVNNPMVFPQNEIEWYNWLLYNCNINDQKRLKVSVESGKLENMHQYLFDIIEAFDKCNSLLVGYQTMQPFPILEVVTYAILLLVCVAVIVLIVIKYRPVQRVNNLKTLLRVKTKHLEGINVPEEDYITGEDSDELEDMGNMYIAKIIGIIAIVAFGIIFMTVISNSGQIYGASLYASDKFRNNECH